MDNFALLGSLAARLHQQFVEMYYVLLPVVFMLALALDWFRNPSGSPDFIETLKRAVIATLLVAGFQEISDAILAITSGIADKISDMSGLDSYIHMVGEKAASYPMSASSLLLGFNDLIVAIINFLSFIILYFARYITVALYHFMWIFLSILAPMLILFNLFRGTSQITINLFKSLFEVASYKIVWAILSAMLTTLSLGNAMAADGSYFTVTILNFVIATAMLSTPMIVKALVGGGLSGIAETLGAGAAVMMASVPVRAVGGIAMTKAAITQPKAFASHMGQTLKNQFNYPVPQPAPLPPADSGQSFNDKTSKLVSK